MLKIKNNPIDILLNVFEKNYSETANKIKEISFNYLEEGYACTVFNDNGIYIYISPVIENNDIPISFEIATELLAHELSHAICGDKEEHGKIWEKTFDDLNLLYEQEAKKIMEERKDD